MKFDQIKEYIDTLLKKNFTGQIRINCHKGDISEKVEVKQTHHLLIEKGEKDEKMLSWNSWKRFKEIWEKI